MQFLMSTGEIAEGEPLTDEQVSQRAELIEYLHVAVCDRAYHGKYGDKKCETLATFFITKFHLSPRVGVSLANETAALLPQAVAEPPKSVSLTPEAQKEYDASEF
jgi:hypothetical protein